MKRKVFTLLLLLSLCTLLTLPVFAEGDLLTTPTTLPWMVDNADLLTVSEEAELMSQLDEICRRQGVDVVIVTTDSTDGASVMAYADDFYDYNGYSADGVLLLISMEERDWYISTSGYGITAFTDDGIDYIGEQISGDLGNGNYAAAFSRFAELCDDFIEQANRGNPYDGNNMPKEPVSLIWIPLSLVIGAVIALIPMNIMKGKLKSVRRQAAAADYVRQGSFQLTAEHDMFLYRNVSRRERPQQSGGGGGGSSTHTSSSGRSHGGGGGKF